MTIYSSERTRLSELVVLFVDQPKKIDAKKVALVHQSVAVVEEDLVEDQSSYCGGELAFHKGGKLPGFDGWSS